MFPLTWNATLAPLPRIFLQHLGAGHASPSSMTIPELELAPSRRIGLKVRRNKLSRGWQRGDSPHPLTNGSHFSAYPGWTAQRTQFVRHGKRGLMA